MFCKNHSGCSEERDGQDKMSPGASSSNMLCKTMNSTSVCNYEGGREAMHRKQLEGNKKQCGQWLNYGINPGAHQLIN